MGHKERQRDWNEDLTFKTLNLSVNKRWKIKARLLNKNEKLREWLNHYFLSWDNGTKTERIDKSTIARDGELKDLPFTA